MVSAAVHRAAGVPQTAAFPSQQDGLEKTWPSGKVEPTWRRGPSPAQRFCEDGSSPRAQAWQREGPGPTRGSGAGRGCLSRESTGPPRGMTGPRSHRPGQCGADEGAWPPRRSGRTRAWPSGHRSQLRRAGAPVPCDEPPGPAASLLNLPVETVPWEGDASLHLRGRPATSRSNRTRGLPVPGPHRAADLPLTPRSGVGDARSASPRGDSLGDCRARQRPR